MEDLIKILAPLGVGGILAGFIFYFYRQDREDSRIQYASLASDFKDVIKSNTSALQGNTDVIRDLKERGICPLTEKK